MTELTTTEKTNENSEIVLPGEILKAARENKGITKKQIGVALNLPERFIEYLEVGDFDKLPGHTFARGYIRNYAKFLELENAEQLVGIFDSYTGTDALGSNVNNLQQIKQIKQISNNIYWLISFIVVLVIVGIIFIWWQGRTTTSATINTIDNTPIVVEPTTSSSTDNQLTIPLSEVGTQNSNNSATEQTTTNTLPIASENSSDVPVTTSETPKTVNPANGQVTTAAASSNSSEGVLQAKFSANCWITINDAAGKTLVSKLMAKGSNLEIKGKAPLEVILGAPNAVTMTYNGQAVTINAKPGATHRIKLGQ